MSNDRVPKVVWYKTTIEVSISQTQSSPGQILPDAVDTFMFDRPSFSIEASIADKDTIRIHELKTAVLFLKLTIPTPAPWTLEMRPTCFFSRPSFNLST